MRGDRDDQIQRICLKKLLELVQPKVADEGSHSRIHPKRFWSSPPKKTPLPTLSSSVSRSHWRTSRAAAKA
jgi:hypothetical protein